ncbi:Aste57867_7530 [Aphanomyces stellatus]|uniref:Aste57867_7530 protein n=1 Tax=Aphanomyces stellatus TaxID=120398 RepID=A0A485KIF9_9STRA|nr:hypothetical protein As57867_007504 [Aphanomyces stellatus]VFT84439.1 Aste57867_7530 [Aphanomyces stellatus]
MRRRWELRINIVRPTLDNKDDFSFEAFVMKNAQLELSNHNRMFGFELSNHSRLKRYPELKFEEGQRTGPTNTSTVHSSIDSIMSLVYLVTGANKGIGYEAVRLLSERLGAKAIVLLGTRSLENGQCAIAAMQQANPKFNYKNVHPIEIDVSKPSSIQAAAAEVRSTYGSLHVLVNNAGISGHKEGPEMCFQVNVHGVHDALVAFEPLMIPNQSINVVVASEVGAWTCAALSPKLQATFANFGTLDHNHLTALAQDWLHFARHETSDHEWPDVASTYGPYGISKTLVIAQTRKWAVDHPTIKTVIVCPGYCATDLNNHSGFRSATQGGDSIVFPIFHPEVTQTGGFYRDGVVHSFNTPRPTELH